MGKTRSKVNPFFSGPVLRLVDRRPAVCRLSEKDTMISPPDLISKLFCGRNLAIHVGDAALSAVQQLYSPTNDLDVVCRRHAETACQDAFAVGTVATCCEITKGHAKSAKSVPKPLTLLLLQTKLQRLWEWANVRNRQENRAVHARNKYWVRSQGSAESSLID
jgi:hypothetical protein